MGRDRKKEWHRRARGFIGSLLKQMEINLKIYGQIKMRFKEYLKESGRASILAKYGKQLKKISTLAKKYKFDKEKPDANTPGRVNLFYYVRGDNADGQVMIFWDAVEKEVLVDYTSDNSNSFTGMTINDPMINWTKENTWKREMGK